MNNIVLHTMREILGPMSYAASLSVASVLLFIGAIYLLQLRAIGSMLATTGVLDL